VLKDAPFVGAGEEDAPIVAVIALGKFVMAHVKDDPANEARIKEFKTTVRGMARVDEFDGPGKCFLTGEMVDRRSVIAKAY
jgi:prolyl-tRNA synthetase